jgi:GTP-binding protein YchF
LQKRIDALNKKSKGNDKDAKAQLEIAEELMAYINDGSPISSFAKCDDEAFIGLNRELRFLSNKEIIYGANVDEDGLEKDSDYVILLKEYAKKYNREVIKLCSKVEEDMVDFDDEEKNEMLSSLGVEASGLDQIIKIGFDKLGLMSYFTAGVKEVRAWTIYKNTTAPKAAAVIHNDFEKGFIRAEVIAYDDYIAYGGENGSKDAGKMRLEGKEYIVNDGDIMHFRFNV